MKLYIQPNKGYFILGELSGAIVIKGYLDYNIKGYLDYKLGYYSDGWSRSSFKESPEEFRLYFTDEVKYNKGILYLKSGTINLKTKEVININIDMSKVEHIHNSEFIIIKNKSDEE
jgi:hypothetical protein